MVMNKIVRNDSIDLLKFLAVLFITNSHFDEQYVYAKELATGGAIGDALFFFCSGYTLFIGRLGRFDTWYKRRIRRIYPSIIAVSLLLSAIWGINRDIFRTFTQGGDWFVSCIMIYYVLLYGIRRYVINHLAWVYGAVCIIIMIWYVWFFEPKDVVWMYKWNYFKWSFFFLPMLMGAQIGLIEKEKGVVVPKLGETGAFLLLNTILFYGIQLLCECFPKWGFMQIVSLLPLLGTCYYLFRFCQTNEVLRMMQGRKAYFFVTVIGGLCLEIYLVQPMIRTTALNRLFPLNLLIIFFGIVVTAYICRSLARFFQQTFSSEDGYDWKKIVSIY